MNRRYQVTTKNVMSEKDRNSIKDYLRLGEVFGYFFRKKDPNRPTNFSIRVMHGVNRIAIIIFLLGVIFLIIRRFMQ